MLLAVSGCVTWRAPQYAAYKGVHTLPDKQSVETIALKTAGKTGEELARVSVLPYSNLSKNKNFDYLSESLSEAVDAAMAGRFEYRRAVLQDIKSVAMRLAATDQRTAFLQELCRERSIDIVIAGFYKSADKNQLEIRTEIFDCQKGNNLGEVNALSRADSSLFTVSEDIAAKTIKAIAESQRR
ncbi:MAG: hypothetical protein NZL89_00100 [Leptospiraceae bacterium]|nr:hypothetical protein [Leptospiraceae bacterium]